VQHLTNYLLLKRSFLSPKKEAMLYQAIGPVYLCWVRLAILTGMRKSEPFHLRWTDVEMEHGFLTLGKTKSGTVQYVSLNDTGITILRGLDSWQRSKLVFTSQNPQTLLNVDKFYGRVYLTAVKRTGLEGATWH
jgi:integrase